jgi:hypothetical protein
MHNHQNPLEIKLFFNISIHFHVIVNVGLITNVSLAHFI